jgi:hypothetical protein
MGNPMTPYFPPPAPFVAKGVHLLVSTFATAPPNYTLNEEEMKNDNFYVSGTVSATVITNVTILFPSSAASKNYYFCNNFTCTANVYVARAGSGGNTKELFAGFVNGVIFLPTTLGNNNPMQRSNATDVAFT